MPSKAPPFRLFIFAACARYSGAPLLPSAAYTVENEGLKTHILQNGFMHRHREFATAPLARIFFKNNHQKMVSGVPRETSLSTSFGMVLAMSSFWIPGALPGGALGSHWSVLGALWASIGRCWASLGPLWGHPRVSWVSLGHPWVTPGSPWGLLGTLRSLSDILWAPLVALGLPWGHPWGTIGSPWGLPGVSLGSRMPMNLPAVFTSSYAYIYIYTYTYRCIDMYIYIY